MDHSALHGPFVACAGTDSLYTYCVDSTIDSPAKQPAAEPTARDRRIIDRMLVSPESKNGACSAGGIHSNGKRLRRGPIYRRWCPRVRAPPNQIFRPIGTWTISVGIVGL